MIFDEFAKYAPLIAGILSTLAAVVVAFLTWKYVAFTKQLVEESKANRSAEVFVDLELDKFCVNFIVGNTGRSPARLIQIGVVDNLPWQKTDHFSGLAGLSPVEHGVSYLAPGRILKFRAGNLDWKSDAKKMASVRFRVNYETTLGKKHEDQFVIRIGEYEGVLLESFNSPAAEIASEIRRLREDRQSERSSERIFSQSFKKTCTHCRKLVSANATKCPHCLEILAGESFRQKLKRRPYRGHV